MLWGRRGVIDQRRDLIARIEAGVSISEADGISGVSRKTASKWWNRYGFDGESGLVDRSRARVTCPKWQTPDVMVERVCAVRDRFPTWGGRKIRALLLREGVEAVPAGSTITAILKRQDRPAGATLVWDLDSGDVFTFAHGVSVNAAVFGPQGNVILTGADDGLVRLWRLDGQAEPVVLAGHTAEVRSVAFSGDGKAVASAGDDQTVIVWDSLTGAETARLVGHTGRVTTVAFGPDAKIASAGSDASVIVWSRLGTSGSPFQEHTKSVRDIGFNLDGSQVFSVGKDGRVVAWKPDGTVKERQEEAYEIQTLAVRDDGGQIATSGDDGVVRLWDADDLSLVDEHSAHSGRVWSVAYSPDGSRVASSGVDGRVVVTELSTGEQTTLTSSAPSKRAVAFGGAELVGWGSDDGTVTVWNLANAAVERLLTEHTCEAWAVASSCEVWAVSISPDLQWIAAAGNHEVVIVWDFESGEHVGTLGGATQDLRDVSFDPKGEFVAAVGQDGSLLIWETGSWNLVNRIDRRAGRLWAVAFHPEEDLIAAAGVDNIIATWDLDLTRATERACLVANRNMSLVEWNHFVGDGSYVRHCPDLPAGVGAPDDAAAVRYPTLSP